MIKQSKNMIEILLIIKNKFKIILVNNELIIFKIEII